MRWRCAGACKAGCAVSDSVRPQGCSLVSPEVTGYVSLQNLLLSPLFVLMKLQ